MTHLHQRPRRSSVMPRRPRASLFRGPQPKTKRVPHGEAEGVGGAGQGDEGGENVGLLSDRRQDCLPMLRVVAGWCLFFNQGCVFHKVGAAEGESYKYKPSACALFPIAKDEKGRWYVRQHGYKGEAWDLF